MLLFAVSVSAVAHGVRDVVEVVVADLISAYAGWLPGLMKTIFLIDQENLPWRYCGGF